MIVKSIQNRIESLTIPDFPSEYSVDIHGYVLVYSIDSRQSFNICEIIHEKMLDLMDDLSA